MIEKVNENARKTALHKTMSQTMGEYPDGRLNDDDAGAVGLAIGIENGRVVLQFPKPVVWVGFTSDDAVEIAVALMKYARRLGLSKTMVFASAAHVADGEGIEP